MTIYSFLFGLIVATFIGLGFHLWKNGGFFKIILNVVLSWIGFFGGHYLGAQMDWDIWIVGPFFLGSAIFGSLAFLFFGHWLSTTNNS